MSLIPIGIYHDILYDDRVKKRETVIGNGNVYANAENDMDRKMPSVSHSSVFMMRSIEKMVWKLRLKLSEYICTVRSRSDRADCPIDNSVNINCLLADRESQHDYEVSIRKENILLPLIQNRGRIRFQELESHRYCTNVEKKARQGKVLRNFWLTLNLLMDNVRHHSCSHESRIFHTLCLNSYVI